MVTRSDAGPREMLPYHTLAEYDDLDKELGKEKVEDVLEDYLNETVTTVQELIRENPGITRSEVTEAMEVDSKEVGPAADVPELTEPGYTPSLISSPDSPPSPVMAVENALLDTPASEIPDQDQSKAPEDWRGHPLNWERPSGKGRTNTTTGKDQRRVPLEHRRREKRQYYYSG